MSIQSAISFGDEPLVEPSFAYTRFVARNQQNGAALRIEGKGHASDAIGGIEP